MARDRNRIFHSDRAFDAADLLVQDQSGIFSMILIAIEETMAEVLERMANDGYEADKTQHPSVTVTFTASAKPKES